MTADETLRSLLFEAPRPPDLRFEAEVMQRIERARLRSDLARSAWVGLGGTLVLAAVAPTVVPAVESVAVAMQPVVLVLSFAGAMLIAGWSAAAAASRFG